CLGRPDRRSLLGKCHVGRPEARGVCGGPGQDLDLSTVELRTHVADPRSLPPVSEYRCPVRFRSVLTVFAMLGALAAGVRCAVPPEPPPSQPFQGKERVLGGAFLTLTGGTLDREGLVASLSELKPSEVRPGELRPRLIVIQPTANQDAAFVQD